MGTIELSPHTDTPFGGVVDSGPLQASPGATRAPDASMLIKRQKTIWKFPLSTFLLFWFSAIDQSTDDKQAGEKGPSYGGGRGYMCTMQETRALWWTEMTYKTFKVYLRHASFINLFLLMKNVCGPDLKALYCIYGFRNTISPRHASMPLHNKNDTT